MSERADRPEDRPSGRAVRRRGVAAIVGGLLVAGVVAVAAPSGASAASPIPAGAHVVAPTGTPSGTTNGTCAAPNYNTIQAAVTASASGGTVYVCAGTYPENVNINVDNLTLDGPQAGVSAVGGRTDTGLEAVIDPTSGSGITYGGTAVTGTIDGLSFMGTAGTNTGISAITGGHYTWQNNIFSTMLAGINASVSATGAVVTDITGSRFTNIDDVNGGAGYGGIFLTNATSKNVTVENNAFSSNGEDLNSINADGLTMSNNTSTGSGNFVVIADTSNSTITGNTITNPAGTSFYLDGENSNVTVSDNTVIASPNSGTAAIRIGNAFHAGNPSSGMVITSNNISGVGTGIVVHPATGGGASLTGSNTISTNTISNSATFGIDVEAGAAAGVQISGNTVTNTAAGAGKYDCFDGTTGVNTGGTANIWTNDVGTTSSPPAICSPDQAPVAVDDSADVAENGSVLVNVLANDTDQNHDTLIVQSVTNPAHGTATISNNEVRYTPATGYTGPDTFSYTVSDGRGGSDTGTVTITVGALASTLTLTPPTATVAPNGSQVFTATVTDANGQPANGQTVVFTTTGPGTLTTPTTVATGPSGTATVTLTVPADATDGATGTVTATDTALPAATNSDTSSYTVQVPAVQTEKPTLTLSSATPGNLHAVVQTDPAEAGVVVHLYTLNSSGGIIGYVAKATTNSAGKAHYTFHGVTPGRTYTLEAKVYGTTPYTEEFSDPATQTVKERTVEKPDLTTSSQATHHLHMVAQTDPSEAGVVVHFYTANVNGEVINYIGHDTTNSSGSAHLTLTNAAHGKTYKIVARVVTHTQYKEVYSDVVWQPVR